PRACDGGHYRSRGDLANEIVLRVCDVEIVRTVARNADRESKCRTRTGPVSVPPVYASRERANDSGGRDLADGQDVRHVQVSCAVRCNAQGVGELGGGT